MRERKKIAERRAMHFDDSIWVGAQRQLIRFLSWEFVRFEIQVWHINSSI